MVKVSSKYNQAFADFLKSIGGKWNAEAKAWEVPEERLAEVEAKAKELNIVGLKVEREKQAQPAEGTIRMRLSKDGRFVLISLDLLAFAEDVKQMLDGKRRTVKFRVLPPRQQ